MNDITSGKLLNSITSLEFNTVRMYQQWIENRGLHFEQMVIFTFILYHEDVTQKKIAEECRLPKQTVHNWIKQLQKDGIVELKQNPKDGRKKIIQFTPKGREYCLNILKPITEISVAVHSKLGDDFFANLLDSLNIYYHSIQKAMEIADLSAEWNHQIEHITAE